jgi:hypothetical protein
MDEIRLTQFLTKMALGFGLMGAVTVYTVFYLDLTNGYKLIGKGLLLTGAGLALFNAARSFLIRKKLPKE